MTHDPNCIFCKIIEGKIPSRKVYEDDEILAFHDIHPWAPVHVLIVPKLHIPSMVELNDEHAPLMGRMTVLATKLMRELGVSNGFRTIVNTGADGGQEVYHLHLHAIGGPRPWAKG
ncbi:MAG: histidine triad nucleotide-binding protein [Burkholderiaceae bacterium]|nr:histidine triad nucleotide-binding protein [Roseateles sp.]MBV8468583.1 histidine triad nucleotide-binding protein [Burkholderiaceae bacterium]